MGVEFNKGFFTFDKTWIQENEFMQSLSHAEYRIMVYLLSSALKFSKKGSHYKRGDLLARLYLFNSILFVNVSQRTIAEKCNVNRSTVMKALRKFEDYGAIITLSDENENNNNFYIIGFENREKDNGSKKEYYFIDSISIRSGKNMSDKIKDTIRDHYQDKIFYQRLQIWPELFGEEEDA